MTDDIKSDASGDCMKLNPDSGMVRVDGIPLCRRVVRRDGVYLQFADRDRQRTRIRGTRYIEVRLDAFINRVA